jgi:hypothetical protein
MEVIEQNPPAIALYESTGFRKTRRLVGYTLPAAQTNGAGQFEECDALEAARFIGAEGDQDLPWMLTVETLGGASSPTRDERRKGHGKALVSALSSRYAGKPLKVISIVPETLAPDFFAQCGFAYEAISQFEMEAVL